MRNYRLISIYIDQSILLPQRVGDHLEPVQADPDQVVDTGRAEGHIGRDPELAGHETTLPTAVLEENNVVLLGEPPLPHHDLEHVGRHDEQPHSKVCTGQRQQESSVWSVSEALLSKDDGQCSHVANNGEENDQPHGRYSEHVQGTFLLSCGVVFHNGPA